MSWCSEGTFNNGPKGAPWAQKLVLGWTMFGQTCLDLTDGAIHVQAKRTCVVTDEDPYMPLTRDLLAHSRPAHTRKNTRSSDVPISLTSENVTSNTVVTRGQ